MGRKKRAATVAGVSGSLAANGWVMGKDGLVFTLLRVQLGERLTHRPRGVFTNEKITRFSASLFSGFRFSRLARSPTTISASSSLNELGYGKSSSYTGLGSEISMHFNSFHYCR